MITSPEGMDTREKFVAGASSSAGAAPLASAASSIRLTSWESCNIPVSAETASCSGASKGRTPFSRSTSSRVFTPSSTITASLASLIKSSCRPKFCHRALCAFKSFTTASSAAASFTSTPYFLAVSGRLLAPLMEEISFVSSLTRAAAYCASLAKYSSAWELPNKSVSNVIPAASASPRMRSIFAATCITAKACCQLFPSIRARSPARCTSV